MSKIKTRRRRVDLNFIKKSKPAEGGLIQIYQKIKPRRRRVDPNLSKNQTPPKAGFDLSFSNFSAYSLGGNVGISGWGF